MEGKNESKPLNIWKSRMKEKKSQSTNLTSEGRKKKCRTVIHLLYFFLISFLF